MKQHNKRKCDEMDKQDEKYIKEEICDEAANGNFIIHKKGCTFRPFKKNQSMRSELAPKLFSLQGSSAFQNIFYFFCRTSGRGAPTFSFSWFGTES